MENSQVQAVYLSPIAEPGYADHRRQEASRRAPARFRFDSLIVPAFSGAIIVWVLFVFVPCIIQAHLGGHPWNLAVGFATDALDERCNNLLLGDFSNTVDWAIPLFGSAVACLLQVLYAAE